MHKFILMAALLFPIFSLAETKPIVVPEEVKAAVASLIKGEIKHFSEDNDRPNPAWDVRVTTEQDETVSLKIEKSSKQLIRASGDWRVNSTLSPGQGVKSPSELRAFFSRYPAFKPREWLLKKIPTGHIYVVTGFESGVEKEYRVEAKTLFLMSVNAD